MKHFAFLLFLMTLGLAAASCKKLKEPMTGYFVVRNAGEETYQLHIKDDIYNNVAKTDSLPDLCNESSLIAFTVHEFHEKRTSFAMFRSDGFAVAQGEFYLKGGAGITASYEFIGHELFSRDHYFVLVFDVLDSIHLEDRSLPGQCD